MAKTKECVGRPALILQRGIVADCPIDCVCVSHMDHGGKKVVCGHYQGSWTNGKGSIVECGYMGGMMATVTITISDLGNGLVHGSIEKVSKVDGDGDQPTTAEKVASLLYLTFKNGEIPGLESQGLEQIPGTIQ